jgi:hypothetical protein
MRNAEVAAQLMLSENTVSGYIKAIYRNTGDFQPGRSVVACRAAWFVLWRKRREVTASKIAGVMYFQGIVSAALAP